MYGQPEITYFSIKCEECNKHFQKITSTHLKKHQLSILEYKEKWGYCHNQPLEMFLLHEIRSKKTLENKIFKNVLKTSKQYRFKKGHNTFNYHSQQQRNILQKNISNVNHHSKAFREKQRVLSLKRKRIKGRFI